MTEAHHIKSNNGCYLGLWDLKAEYESLNLRG